MLISLPAHVKTFYCVYYSLLEIMGGEKADEIFSLANLDPFDLTAPKYLFHGHDLIDLIASVLVSLFGEDTARGLLIRVGGASLSFFRRYYPGFAQLGSIENRLKPIDRRFKDSLEKCADVLTTEMGSTFSVVQVSGRTYEWQMANMDGACGNNHFAPYFFFGLLEEFCLWLDSRKNYILNFAPEPSSTNSTDIAIQIRDME